MSSMVVDLPSRKKSTSSQSSSSRQRHVPESEGRIGPQWLRRPTRQNGFTADSPTPYLLQDLINLIDERMGKLENRASRMTYHRLMGRIEAIRNDPRYGFMFENANVGGDTMAAVLSRLFRLEDDGRPITVLRLASLPGEAVDAVVCVVLRLAFEFGLWSDGALPLLVVCEEAHRYASADPAVVLRPPAARYHVLPRKDANTECILPSSHNVPPSSIPRLSLSAARYLRCV